MEDCRACAVDQYSFPSYAAAVAKHRLSIDQQRYTANRHPAFRKERPSELQNTSKTS